jgi:ATP-dependent protease HslVU (ClpYQ) peptidase subunit
MTAIVYSHKHKEIAFDSRASRGGTIVTDNFNKHYHCCGVDYIISGSPADAELLILMYQDPSIQGVPEIDAFVVDEGCVFSVHATEEGSLSCLKIEHDMGIGSGGDWALAALDFGETPRKAIKYACTRDLYSGGKIKTVKVK